MGDNQSKNKGFAMIDVQHTFCLRGRYLLQVLDTKGNILRAACTDNLIMQSGIDALLKHPDTHGFTMTSLCEKCWVGNDNTKPELNNTGLGSVLYTEITADWESLVLNKLAASYTMVGTRVFNFPHMPREYLIWEVGTSPVVGSPWFSRATVPAAIIIKPKEKLKVVFELTLEVSTVKVTGSMPFAGSNLVFSLKYNAPHADHLELLWKSPMLVTGNPHQLSVDVYYPGEYWDSGIPGIGTKHLPPWKVQGEQLSYNETTHKYGFSTPLNLPPVPIAALGCYSGATTLPFAVEFPVPPRLNADQYFTFTAGRSLVNR